MNVGYYVPPDFTSSIGAATRMIMDVGAWHNSVAQIMPGQSGDPGSVHYCDGLDDWLDGTYFPLLFHRDTVLRHVSERLILLP